MSLMLGNVVIDEMLAEAHIDEMIARSQAFDDNRWYCFDCKKFQPRQVKFCVYCGSQEVENVA